MFVMPQTGPPNHQRSSVLVSELDNLSAANFLLGFPVTKEAKVFWRLLVEGSYSALSATSLSDWVERMEPRFEQEAGQIDIGFLQTLVDYVEKLDLAKVERFAKAVGRQSWRTFAHRRLGEGQYRRIESAFRRDLAAIVAALRRVSREAMPYATAMDDLAAPLSVELVTKLMPGLKQNQGLVFAFFELDRLMSRAASSALLSGQALDALPKLEDLDAEELSEVVSKLRGTVSRWSLDTVSDLNSSLERKIRGARQALEYSPDPVSQAANSIIELIDRLLRNAFSEDEYLAWIEASFPDRLAELTHIDKASGIRRPTKRGQALCFVHAGIPVSESVPMNEIAASSLVTIRAQLQKLKHADRGTPEELEEAQQLLLAFDGFVALAIGLSWATSDDTAVQRLKNALKQS